MIARRGSAATSCSARSTRNANAHCEGRHGFSDRTGFSDSATGIRPQPSAWTDPRESPRYCAAATYRDPMDEEFDATPEQLLAALDASELVERVSALTEAQRGDLLERMALLIGANHAVTVEEFRSELGDILASGPTFHAVLHGGRFDGQVMELDPEEFDAAVICAAIEGEDAAVRASDEPNCVYRLTEGSPAPGSTVHYRFDGLIDAHSTSLEQSES